MYPIVIAAKSNSSRISKKNFRNFHSGKSLVDFSLDLAFSLDPNQHVILSTDHLNYISDYPFIFHRREASLAHKDTPIIDVLIDIINTYELHSSKYILLLQPTSPFRTQSHLREFTQLISSSVQSNPNTLLTVFSVYKVEDAHPARMYQIDDGHLKPLDSELAELQCQFLPNVYHRNGGFYCFSIDAILSGSLYTELQIPYIMSIESSINIDTPLDFEFAQYLADKSDLFK